MAIQQTKQIPVEPQKTSSIDSYISMAIGLAVVLIIGAFAFNFAKRSTSTETGTDTQNASESAMMLPTTHEVKAGESLWNIAETYYEDGYQWTRIAEANGLANADDIREGQSLTIPAYDKADTGEISAAATTTPSAEAVKDDQPADTKETPKEEMKEESKPATSGKSYTVVQGDSLWKIAVASYGDGYKWVDIARANKLANPDLIHPGNVFVLP